MHAATPLESPRQGSKLYTWSFPGAPVQIDLHFNVVQGILQECLSRASTTGDSASQRGLLLGKINAPGLLEITGFQPPSTPNVGELEAAVAGVLKEGDSDLLPIGYFRIHPEGRLALAPEDLSLAQTFFPNPNNVILLIQPSDTGPANAGFFFWDRGKVNGGFYDFCFLEFPFDVSMLTESGRRAAKTDPQPPADLTQPEPLPSTLDTVSLQPRAVTAPVESLPPTSDPPPSFPLPEIKSPPVIPPENLQETKPYSDATPKPRSSSRAIRLALTAVLLVVAGFAISILLTQKIIRMAGIGMSDATPLALKVQRQGTDLAVTWNHNSPLVMRADSGRLTMYDGNSASRELSLSKEYLRSGSVVYSPATDHVRVQLDVLTPDQKTTSESVMAVLNRPETTDSSVVVQAVEVPPLRPTPPSHSLDTAARPPGATVTSSKPPSPSPADAKVRATREFLPPQERAATQPQPLELAVPPPVTAVNPGPAATMALTLPLSHQPLPTPNSPVTTPTTATLPQDSSRPSSRLSFPSGPADYTPPVPIRQLLLPPLTAAQRSFISRTTVVEIRVFIDASGKVRKTEPLTRANPALATAAQSTARLWSFHPARRAGQNVPSEMVLQFKFEPPK